MKARLAIVILAAPLWAWAADSGANGAHSPALASAPPSERIQPAVIQSAPAGRTELANATHWSSMQATSTRGARTETVGAAPSGSPRSDGLPNSGLQFYALIAAGIAAVGFMASRRTHS
ncbi:hypothetical protein [Caldimonas caldifontis]|uniref:IPTL-CTERM protein sorting domain-containing protein n=1 Tax=Caldimonas caldifontis TaxID=1452508 RepID=A0A2S5SS69_9BURK|nr:hypothetical protein [Caldimonas caldifontis]PPE65549.1 hypothetical protein C1704_14080 [Caldimonas caldifontis]